MRYHIAFNGFNKAFNFLMLCFFLTACAEVGNKKTLSFDVDQVDSMAFQFEKNTLFLGNTLLVEKISQQVILNLQEWGYIFKEDNTHDLKISIGSVSHSTTPFGLSFTPGNSNPRSLDFQKTTSFLLTCSLMPKGLHESAELAMDVLAESYTKLSSQPTNNDKITELLTDDISTVCYNLLSSLNIKIRDADLTEKKLEPSWIPEIRIEVDNEIKNEIEVNDQNNQKPTKVNTKKEARKRIIIHNKGTPVIFKFGSDR